MAKALFTAIQADQVNQVFYDESILKDDNNEPECIVKTVVSVKNLKNVQCGPKTININMTIKDNNMLRNVMYVQDEVESIIPENIDREVNVIQESEEDNENKEKVKPRIIKNELIHQVKNISISSKRKEIIR